jgi:hypothetical protein
VRKLFYVDSPLRNRKAGMMPVHPLVRIALGSHFECDDGVRTLSPNLMTEREVDHTIDSLIEQLEKVRKDAKRELLEFDTTTLARE